MHLHITLASDRPLEVPMHYNHILQGIIYNTIDADLAAFLHDQGFISGGRTFKLFTISRLMGRFEKGTTGNTLCFPEAIRLVVSSPVEEFCQSIANGLLTKGVVHFGAAPVEVREIVVEQQIVEENQITVRTLSPIVAYSTLDRPDGRKYTCYFQPGEQDFTTIVEGNLRKKYQACYGKNAPQGEVTVRKIGELKQNIVKYKDFIIKGYSGRVQLTGPSELLQIAVDAGVGSKNSQGFGCVEVVAQKLIYSYENKVEDI